MVKDQSTPSKPLFMANSISESLSDSGLLDITSLGRINLSFISIPFNLPFTLCDSVLSRGRDRWTLVTLDSRSKPILQIDNFYNKLSQLLEIPISSKYPRAYSGKTLVFRMASAMITQPKNAMEIGRQTIVLTHLYIFSIL